MKTKRIILVVDDEEADLELFRTILEKEGYMVLTADKGKDGLDQVRREKPNLVILDLKMPDMSGIAVLREIKKFDENTEVIIITGYGAMKSARMAMRLGAYEYITKPFDIDYVKAVVGDALSSVSDSAPQKVRGEGGRRL